MQEDIRKYRTHDTTLWGPGDRVFRDISLKIPGFQGLPEKIEEASVRDSLRDDFDQSLMVDQVEARLDVPFDEPICGVPQANFFQTAVCTPISPESVTAIQEGWSSPVVDTFQDESDDLLDDLVSG